MSKKTDPITLALVVFAMTPFAGMVQAGPADTLRDLDVPFIVSPPLVTQTMLEMARVAPGDFVIDLGSGDGRIVVLAAKNHGARGLGVEIDPALVETARANAKKVNVTDRVSFRVEDLFTTNLSVATVITMYLLPDVNIELRPRLLKLTPGTRIVSHDWDMGDWAHDDMRVVDNPEKPVGREKTSKVFMWVVPANVNGKWCALQAQSPTQRQRAISLDLGQKYQMIDGLLTASASGKSPPLSIRFLSTLNGDRFVIPHSAKDAPAIVGSDAIRLDGSAYGLSKTLTFRRDAQCGPHTAVASR